MVVTSAIGVGGFPIHAQSELEIGMEILATLAAGTVPGFAGPQLSPACLLPWLMGEDAAGSWCCVKGKSA